MKIAIIGSSNFDSLEYHIADSLSFLNHEVKIFDFYKIIPFKKYKKYELIIRRLSDTYLNYVSNKTAKDVINYNPDLVIGTYRDIHPFCIETIKRKLTNAPVIQINPDQLTTLEHQQIFASNYDFYFSKDMFMVKFMRDKMNLNAYYLPECFNQRVCKTDFATKIEAEKKIKIDVLIYGTFYPYRNRIIDYLIKSGINIKMCGNKGHYFPKHLDKHFLYPIYGQDKSDFIF